MHQALIEQGKLNLVHVQADEEEHVQCVQAQGFHGEEITGEQLLLVLAWKLPEERRGMRFLLHDQVAPSSTGAVLLASFAASESASSSTPVPRNIGD